MKTPEQMTKQAADKVIYVDFQAKRRVPVRTGFKVVEHTFDAITYYSPGYKQLAEIAKSKNMCRISQLHRLLDAIEGK